jgi:hypothetical protein
MKDNKQEFIILSTWLPILTTYKTPPAIWKALQDKFAREIHLLLQPPIRTSQLEMEFKSKPPTILPTLRDEGQ